MAQRFGRYWLHERIGQGGMADIYRATIGPDPETFAFELAIKRLQPEHQKDPALVEMFLTEADLAKLLRHPNIVQVYESGTVESQPYIAMECIWGYDLATLIELLRKRRLRFPSDLAVFTAMQILRALDYIHSACSAGGQPMELVHRDVTPSNIFVTYGGEVKLADFGVARVSFLESFEESQLLKGKAAYMPPEVLAGAPVDQRVDLWSVAVTLYEMLTARRLFEGVSEAELVDGTFKPHIEPVHRLNADLSEGLSALLQRALSLKAKKRPATAAELYRQLKAHMVAEGVTVDATALSRFIGAVTETRPSRAPLRAATQTSAAAFESPTYQVPVDMSPTQRFAATRRRRQLAGPIAAVVAAAALAIVGWALLRPRAGGGDAQRGASQGAFTPGQEGQRVEQGQQGERGQPGQSGDAAAARAENDTASARDENDTAARAAATDGGGERDRPPVPDEIKIEFSDELGEDAQLDNLGATPTSRFKTLMQKARAQAQKRRFAQADEAFRQAQEIRPKHIAPMLGRANALLELKRYKEAEQLVRAALQLRPKEGRAHLLLGDVLWVQGKDIEAKQAYQRCIEADPNGNAARIARRILASL